MNAMLLFVSALTTTIPAPASDMLGVYCIVDKVVLEPADRPDRAQIWGTCATAIPEMGNLFDKPARGYFYYRIPPGQDDVVRAEWADIRAAAGTGDVVAWGARYAPDGRFRPATEVPTAPDAHPLNFGVSRGKPNAGRWSFGNSTAGTARMLEELSTLARQEAGKP
jgi:hypothetical protein